MSNLLQNKVAIVTGANRGIGKSILEIFAKNGCNIFACSRTESDEFSSNISNLVEKYHVEITPIYFDLKHADQIKESTKKIISSKQNIDILVNNAGIASGSLFQMLSIKETKEIFEINFFSQLLFTQTMARYMSRSKNGSIINIASTAGLIGNLGTVSYGSSKAALIYATKSIATELGPMNIRVNAIAPGITKTDMFNQMDEKIIENAIDSSALKRPAEPYEIANVALFLASDLSSYLTGQVIRVDGGTI